MVEEGVEMDHLKLETIELQSAPIATSVCRLCAKESDKIIGVYSEEGVSNELATKINQYLPIKVSEGDIFPLQCCLQCATTVLAWHELLITCVEAENHFMELQGIEAKTVEIEEYPDEADDPDDDLDTVEIQEPEVILEPTTSQEPEAMARLKAASLTALNQTAPNKKRKAIKQRLKVLNKPWLKEDSSTDSLFINGMNISDNSLKEDYDEMSRFDVIKNECLELDKTDMDFMLDTRKLSDEVSESDDNNEFNVSKGVYRIKSSDNPEIYVYTCQLCSSVFQSESEIHTHLKEKHPEPQPVKKGQKKNTKIDQEVVNKAQIVVEGKIYYHCKLCGKNLHSPYTYMWHTRIHTGERPFICDLCGKQFRVSQGLVRHLKETHEGIKNFPCDLCGRMFATKRNVEEHRRIHTNERPYVCDLCGKAFKQKASLFVHNRSHSDTFPFHCSYCNQGFRTRPPLLLHVTRHTGEKPYACEVCGRCFRIKYELKRHMLIHSDEKPFVCSECGANFRQKRYLRNHTRINHHQETP